MGTQKSPSWLHVQGEDVLLDFLVVPRASRTRLMGVHDERLKLQLTAPPVGGKANRALVEYVAKLLGVSKVQISVIGGLTSRRKTVRVMGVTRAKVLLVMSPRC